MGRTDLEEHLAPIAGDQPCGENLEYDPEFIALAQASQPVPEQEMGETVVQARDPDWRDVAKRAEALLAHTKDLRVTTLLTRALLLTQGFAGLRDGLWLTGALLDRYWPHVHPQLDADDDDDPTFRLNSLAALCSTDGLVRDIRRSVIVTSRSFGPVTWRDVAIATGEITSGTADEKRDLAQINAAFMDCGPSELLAAEDAVKDSARQVSAIDATLIGHLGAGNTIDLSPLAAALKGIDRLLTEKVAQRNLRAPPAGPDEAMEEAGSPAPGAVAAAAVVQITGEVCSREDVVRLLEKICAYYERHEPSSPVPLLLNRAKRLVPKSFIDILRDMAPDGVAQVELIRGADGDSA